MEAANLLPGQEARESWPPVLFHAPRRVGVDVAARGRERRDLISDGWSGYCGLPDHDHQPKVVGATPAHLVLTWIHRVFSNLKRWALGTFHGLLLSVQIGRRSAW